jgi:diguanylate cyclase (GGDEF)-like protein
MILAVVRSLDVRQSERAAIDHARYVIGALVHDELVATDLRHPVEGERRRALDRMFERRVLVGGSFRLSFQRPDGVITYSTDHSLIGRDRPSLVTPSAARAVSTVANVSPPNGEKDVRALVTGVPVVVGAGARQPGTIVLEQEYAPIAAAASDSLLPIAGVLELVLLGFMLLLVPTLARTTTRIRRHAEQIEQIASHDPLTGLPNRGGLQRELSDLGSSDATVAVIRVGLDRFKEVNAALGYECGDEVLVRVAQTLRATAKDAVVARVGGDEFAVVREVSSRGDAIELAQRVRQTLESPLTLSGVPVQVTVTAGVALAPEHGRELDVLLQQAEVAMYTAKHEQAGLAVYDAGADGSSADRLALMAELRDALQAGELDVWFQPIVSLRAAKTIGMEALVRWAHPVRGLISPVEVIPLLDHMGLLRPLHRLVLEKSLACCRMWADLGVNLSISVNITVRDLLDPALPDEVAAALGRHGVPAQRLILEITESMLMTDADRARTALERLQQIGVRVAIDDFGTGYSSLAYRLPVHAIKLDRSFVAGMLDDAGTAAIVRTTLDLGRTLGLPVVAEGIERREQWERLVELGCLYGQGYLFGRPAPADRVSARIRKRMPARAA